MQAFETHTAAAIPAGQVTLFGDLHVPAHAQGLVLFAHGSGSSRNSPRNQRVAEFLHAAGLATLLFDLLAPEEEPADGFDARLRFNIDLLAHRLRLATRWARQQPSAAELLIGYFGASTGAAAAICAATADNAGISAIVSRGGRVDLAEDAIQRLTVPTLLIVGSNDEHVAALNLEVWARLRGEKAIETIPGAGHLFEEPGALHNVALLAARWFGQHLR